MGMAPNVILIVCDTLRRDAVSVYNRSARTPFLSKLARDSVVYDNAVAPAPWTFPSHVSLFTGMYPNQHHVHESSTDKLPQIIDKHAALRAETLPEYMRSLGYNTVGISNNIGVSRFTGFDRGFDTFFNLETSPWWQGEEVKKAREMGSNVSDVVKELIKQGRLMDIYSYAKVYMKIMTLVKATNYPINKGIELTNNILFNGSFGSNFFMFLNLMEMHEPYIGYSDKEATDDFAGVRPISPERVRYLKRQYASEAEYMDSKLEETISMLKSRGLYDDSMIIITSDHGQAFYEHRFLFHEIYLYDEIIRVPMMVKYPKGKRHRQRRGYQSLVNVKQLVREVIEGGDDSSLYSDSVFSEAYGNTRNTPSSYGLSMKFIDDKYEKHRKCVFRDGYKLTVNGTDRTIEEFMKGGKSIDPSGPKNKAVARQLLDEIEEFKGGERFAMPHL